MKSQNIDLQAEKDAHFSPTAIILFSKTSFICVAAVFEAVVSSEISGIITPEW